MNLKKAISILSLMAVVFVTSCSKVDSLKEKEDKSDESCCCDGVCDADSKGMVLTNENGDPNITDPDHDEEHDKDDAIEVKEE